MKRLVIFAFCFSLFAYAGDNDDVALTASSPEPRPPWKSFEIHMIGEDVDFVGQINPVYEDEMIGVGASTEVLEPVHIYRAHLDGTDKECLTCESSPSPYNYNYHNYISPDGEHVVFISTRDRAGPDINKTILTFGGEVYIMNRDGSNQTRLTYLNGFARAPIFSKDGERIHWTQVTSDHRWHLLFADLLHDEGGFHIENIRELRVLPGPDSPPSATLTRRLAWMEWKNNAPEPATDWWTIGATFGNSMNVDIYAVSLDHLEVYRLTTHPENEEFANWDPTGRGLGIMSGREHYQVRQILPLPLPSLNDYITVVVGLIIVQTARVVPWGTDLFYMDRMGEEGMIKLVEGAKDGYLITPNGWSQDGSRLYFLMWRPKLANPDPHGTTMNFGYVEFSGRPDGFAMKDSMPAFLGSATKDICPAEVIPFDPEDIYPTVDETISGLEGGQVRVNIHANLDFSGFSGWVNIDFKNFDDGDYTISGKDYSSYNFPSNILGINVTMDQDLDFVSSEGIPSSVRTTWRSLSVLIKALIVYKTRGNLDMRLLMLDPFILLPR